jgi:dihydrolipoamide dehydrogenase
MSQYDLVVIGGGPAGYNSAEYASKNGLKVLLAEKNKLGGTCLNRGCIPTKTFLYASKIYHYANGAGKSYGVTDNGAALDHTAVVRKKDEVVGTLVQGIAGGLRREKVKVIEGEASITKNNGDLTVTVGSESYTAKNIILATGSSPFVPPIEGIKDELAKGRAVTSDEILDMEEVPEKLTIVGGGVIGFEMAAYFNEAGSKVTVVEMLDKVLGPNDREVSQLLQKEMEKKGIVFHLSSTVKAIKDGVVTFTKDGQDQTVEYDKVLMSVGRKANISINGLDTCGVQLERGTVVVNEQCKTTAAGIYAIGDVNGKITLAHVAYREGEVAVNTILGKKDAMSYDAICGVVYTNPEAAFVGMSEEQAKAAGIEYTVKKVSINFSGRHVVEHGMSEGICKIIIDKNKNIVIGAAIMSAYASEYIYSLALMIENRIPVSSIRKTVFPHPTVCEIIREALLA